MKKRTWELERILGGLLVLLMCAAPQIYAQGRGGRGGGGGFGGGFGGGGGVGGGAAGTTTYSAPGGVGTANITVDPQTHDLIISADLPTLEQIQKVVAQLDVAKPQVLIKVVFIEVQHNNGSDIGVEGGWGKNDIGHGIASSAGNVLGLSGLNTVVTNLNTFGQPMSSALSPSGTGAGLGTFYQIVGTDFQATLRALAETGKAQILSRPSILARDGQLARIVVGQQVPLPTSVTYTTAGGGNTIPIVNVSYTDVGIILNVTPFIGESGLVEMIVQPQISTVSQTERQQLSSDVSAPYLNVRSADTVVVTPDGETAVIGGLISKSKTSNESRVPFLGSIPLLGNLFKSKTKTDAKNELLIFLTPHIVQAPSELAMVSVDETRQSNLITNTVSERDLDRFLERIPVKNP